jgi:DNA-binding transcriptional LysR family regulator
LMLVCASPAYISRRGAPETPEDLNAHDNVTFPGGATCLRWGFARGEQSFDVEPPARLTVNSSEAALEAALFGLGIMRVLSTEVENELRSGALVPLLTAFAPRPTPVSLVHSDRASLPLKVRAFLDYCAPRLRERFQRAEAEPAVPPPSDPATALPLLSATRQVP